MSVDVCVCVCVCVYVSCIQKHERVSTHKKQQPHRCTMCCVLANVTCLCMCVCVCVCVCMCVCVVYTETRKGEHTQEAAATSHARCELC